MVKAFLPLASLPLGATLAIALLSPCPPAAAQPQVSAMQAWPLGPPPPLPPLPQQAKGWSLQASPAKPRWERVAQRQRLRWERVPSHERILPDTLAISEGPQSLELVQEIRPARRWEPVEAPRRVVGRVWFRF